MAKYTTTSTPTKTPDGRPGFRIECTCTTHPAGMNAAIVVDRGSPFDKKLIHGTVLGAHHPVVGKALVRKGIWAA
jgi:hypothetical protein